MTFTEQERATLRAALHCWQNELSYYTPEELRSYYPDLAKEEPLTDEQVTALWLRMTKGAR